MYVHNFRPTEPNWIILSFVWLLMSGEGYVFSVCDHRQVVILKQVLRKFTQNKVYKMHQFTKATEHV